MECPWNGKMRDLLFKNLTSIGKRRKIISSSEITDKEGVRRVINRHMVCIVKEIDPNFKEAKPLPYLYVRKEHNDKDQVEKFFCRMKANIYATSGDKLYMVRFMHSLKITLFALSEHKSQPQIWRENERPKVF